MVCHSRVPLTDNEADGIVRPGRLAHVPRDRGEPGAVPQARRLTFSAILRRAVRDALVPRRRRLNPTAEANCRSRSGHP